VSRYDVVNNVRPNFCVFVCTRGHFESTNSHVELVLISTGVDYVDLISRVDDTLEDILRVSLRGGKKEKHSNFVGALHTNFFFNFLI